VAAVAALAGPSAASAFAPEPPGLCEGESIHGNGSTFQEFAQLKVWIPDFNKFDCLVPPATEPVVTYTPTGSGPGLESWGVESATSNFGPTNAFVGTDNAPTQKQREEIESHASSKVGSGVETIPVEQAAVAVIVHLPADCTAKSGKKETKKARIVISNEKLNKIFEGTAHWNEFSEGKDKLKCKGKEGKAAEASLIKRVVRLEGSGTTAIEMKYLGLVTGPTDKVIGGTTTWDEEAQLAANTEWPNNSGESAVIRGKGNGGVVSETFAHPGTIAMANLANARAKFGAGEGTQTFWAPLENSPGHYEEPSTNGDSTTTPGTSNCEATNYTNGKRHFPPETTLKPWNEVTTALVEPHYTMCGLTYDLGVQKYELYPGTNAKEARTVFDFYNYMLSDAPTGGGTKIDENTDYGKLPSEVREIAEAGVSEISFH